MKTYNKKLTNKVLIAYALALPWTFNLAHAGAGIGSSTDSGGAPIQVPTYYANSPNGKWTDWAGVDHDSGTPLRKFVDDLPGLGASAANNLGQYIPVAKPDTSTFPDADYYEIAIVEYTEQLHSDLPKATRLRGYVQLATAVVPGSASINVGGQTYAVVDKPHYLGPTIAANRGRPVRIKYVNLLPAGELFLPVDETLGGAGMGPDGRNKYAQNRIVIHLHGGDSPWISDGTPHQWVASALENTPYTKGDSQRNVPDMWFNATTHTVVPAASVPADPVAAGLTNDPGPGAGTLYYPNAESARMMWYHDHAVGLTRVNVYAGMAAGYLVNEPAIEAQLPAMPGGQIPLIIQEKTFVPKDIAVQDRKWDQNHWGKPGDLWFPHVYEFNQDPNSFDNTNPPGRWDYAALFWPIYPAPLPMPSGSYGDVTTTPEAFGDTAMVNGTAYPKLTVEPTATRFRILNATNDRTLNLGLYVADPSVITDDGRVNTELKMVPFDSSYNPKLPNFGFPAKGGLKGTGWGQPDGRLGGVPDPASAGPDIIQIGSEGGFLPNPVTIPSTPINYEYNKRSVTVLNVLERGMYMMPAERADAVIDFSQYPGKTLIVYNDAPAPNPAGDPRVDYYTGDPDQTDAGGATATLAGYGPNTRSIMQIEVGAGNQPINDISIINGGSNYVNPKVNIVGGNPTTPATAVVNFSSTTVAGVNIDAGGSGYTDPVVSFTGGGASQSATGTAVLAGPIAATITMASGGSGFDPANPPTVLIHDQDLNNPNNANPTATAHIESADIIQTPTTKDGVIVPTDPATYTYTIQKITVDTQGSGYSNPVVDIAAGGSTGNPASATAKLDLGNPGTVISAITITDPGVGYSSVPDIAITDTTGSNAMASATMNAGSIVSIKLTNPGAGYKTAPTIVISGGTGSGAIATANFAPKTAWDAKQLNAALPKIYAQSQATPLVPESAYNKALGTSFADTVAMISTGSYIHPTFDFVTPVDVKYTTIIGTTLQGPLTYVTPAPDNKEVVLGAGSSATVAAGTLVSVAAGTPVQMPVLSKAIQELFDEHGRMNATLGVELPFTSQLIQTTIPLNFIDPATETIADGETQIWKITHNGVDAHPVHFHLVNVQVVNRVGWDGTRKAPDDNEQGWKETVKMNPLEDVIVAVRAKAPKMPFSIGGSKRLLDPTQPAGSAVGFTQIDPMTGNPATIVNTQIDYGWEYVWHCHILGHEENDFMRPFIFTGATNYNTADVTPPTTRFTVSPAPNALGWNNKNATVTITATDNPAPNGSGIASVTYSAGGANPIAQTKVKAAKTVDYSVSASPVVAVEGTTTFSANGIDQAAIPNTGNLVGTDVKLDKTAPTVTGTAAPVANALGWNNTPVTVNFTASDALSGLVAGTPATYTVSQNAEGKNSVPWSVADNAGNTTAVTKAVNIDMTKPLVTGGVKSPAAVGGWNKSNVTVSLMGTDALSGIANCDKPVASTEGINQSVSGYCKDNADNMSLLYTLSGINLDKTAPTLTWSTTAVPTNGWYNLKSALTYTWKAVDALSGLSATQPGKQATTGVVTFLTQNVNVATPQTKAPTFVAGFTGFTDIAGNSSGTALLSPAINIDATAPILSFQAASPVANSWGWNKTGVTIPWIVSDALSGLPATQPNGSATSGSVALPAANTVAAGNTANATFKSGFVDVAGNASATSFTSPAVKIDVTAPTITAAVAPAPNATLASNGVGWNKAAVKVTFTGADALSGMDTALTTAPVTLSTEGLGVAATGSVTDKAGNTTSLTKPVNLDMTLPTATLAVSAVTKSAATYVVTFSLSGTAVDSLSSVSSATYMVTAGATSKIATTAITPAANGSITVTGKTFTGVKAPTAYTVTLTVTDKAGNVKTATATFTI